MKTQPKHTAYYELESVCHYAEDERYSNGKGLAVISDDQAQLETTFSAIQSRGERYAITITRLDTGAVVRSHGDITAARQSSRDAYRRRAALAAAAQ